MVFHCFCLHYCYILALTLTLLSHVRTGTRSSIVLFLPRFILARRKNFITLYHDFIVSVLQLHSFVLFFFHGFILRVYVFRFVSLCFVLYCNVGFCFVFLLYVPEQCSLVVFFFFIQYLLNFTCFVSLNSAVCAFIVKSRFCSYFFVNRLKKMKNTQQKSSVKIAFTWGNHLV